MDVVFHMFAKITNLFQNIFVIIQFENWLSIERQETNLINEKILVVSTDLIKIGNKTFNI